jgi:glycosyltransferase involved in cell wall biosynthesis
MTRTSDPNSARVSILMPTRNRAAWLRGGIEAALRQSFGDFQLLVFDNASTDETPEVVASFDDPRIRYERQPQDVGLVENHNRGLAAVETEYVIIVPDDDVMYPALLERTVEALDRLPRAGMVHTAIDMLGPDGELVAAGVNWTMGLSATTVESGADFISESMKYSCRVCASTALMRRSALPAGYFDPADYPPVDLGLWLRMATGWDMAFLSDTLAGYRVHDHSHSAAVGTRTEEGYVRDVGLMRRQHEVKLRFVDEHVRDDAEARRLRRQADAGKRTEVVTGVRQRTVPERRLRPTLAAVAGALREEPLLALDYRVWRLVAAATLGRRLTDRLLGPPRAGGAPS